MQPSDEVRIAILETQFQTLTGHVEDMGRIVEALQRSYLEDAAVRHEMRKGRERRYTAGEKLLGLFIALMSAIAAVVPLIK